MARHSWVQRWLAKWLRCLKSTSFWWQLREERTNCYRPTMREFEDIKINTQCFSSNQQTSEPDPLGRRQLSRARRTRWMPSALQLRPALHRGLAFLVVDWQFLANEKRICSSVFAPLRCLSCRLRHHHIQIRPTMTCLGRPRNPRGSAQPGVWSGAQWPDQFKHAWLCPRFNEHRESVATSKRYESTLYPTMTVDSSASVLEHGAVSSTPGRSSAACQRIHHRESRTAN